ncbi:hypothetical protein L596_024369 [Steinernema carpocapsae]|uniref:Haloacid dehalogenase-like hydrolase domain-containing protein 3 n=1 Tax=Steinernema carpocapsae TaxID=34508 RepID=A0A4U5MGJ6_STECR|nr:hypothetical protein L596_024369 [Steinernema carpocapsae]
MHLRRIRVLSLDAMKTIIRLRESPGVVYARTAAECGINADPEEVLSRFFKSFKKLEKTKPAYDFAGKGAKRWWNEVVAESLGFEAESKDPRVEQAQMRLFDLYATADAWAFVDKQILSQLNHIWSRDIHIVVASNFDFRLRRILSELRIAPLIDEFFLSGEIGLQKPDPRYFLHVLQKLNLTDHPELLLHVGDNLQKDSDCPRALGINAVLLDAQATPFSSHTPSIRSLNDLLFD